jgi:4-amino-4-deoxy-L-arabinose transferase-like glycosyltransferase
MDAKQEAKKPQLNPKSFSGKLRGLLKINPDRRFQLFLIALVLVIAGQIIMHRNVPIDSWIDLRQLINDWLRIDVKFLGNVMIGLGCSILGGLIFAIAANKSEFFQEDYFESFPIPEVPILKKFYLSKWVVFFLIGMAFFILLLIRASTTELEFFDFLFWVVAIYFISRAVLRYDRAAGATLKLEISRREVVIILLLIIIGLLIATYQLQDIPNVIKGDEGTFFETARSIAKGDYSQSIFGFGVYSYPIFSSFIQGAIVRVFGADMWGWRFASVVPALLSVIPLYFISRDFFNRQVALLAGLVYISSSYFLSFARLGYNNSQAILYVSLCFWLYFLGYKKNSLFYMYLAGVVSGLGFLTYTSGRLGVVIIAVLFTSTYLLRFLKKPGKRFLYVSLVIMILGWGLLSLPHLTYGFNTNPQTLRYKMVEGVFFNFDYASGLFGEREILDGSVLTTLDNYQVFVNSKIYGRLLLRGVIRTILGFQIDEYSNNFFISSSLAGPIAVIFYVFGIYAILTHFWRSNVFPIIVWFVTGTFFLSIISTYPPRPAHMVPLIPVLALFTGLGIYLAIERVTEFAEHKGWTWQPLKFSLTAIITILIMVAGTREYFYESPQVYRPNLEQVMNWAGLHNPSETEFIYVYSDEAKENWVPYLFRLELTNPQMSSVSLTDVTSNNVEWPQNKDFAIFIEEFQAELLLPKFAETFGSGSITTILDRDRRAIGRVVVQGNVDLATEVSLFTGLKNLFTSRIMWLILPLVALELFLIYRMRSELNLQPLKEGYRSVRDFVGQVPLKIDLGKTPTQSQPKELSTSTPRSIEFGLFLKLGLRNVARDFQAKIVLKSDKERITDVSETGED